MRLTVPALRFEAEAFRLGEDKILGRQSAGDAFMRALLALPDLTELVGCGPNPATAQSLGQMIAAVRRDLRLGWTSTSDNKALAGIGAVHFPDPMLPIQARTRLAAGSAAYSISGVTHTISSAGVMQMLADFAQAPLMEWDGVICTSDAVRASVLELLGQQEEYLAWRFPGASMPARLQLPVIPLGVHCDDFTFTEAQRAEARKVLGLGAGEVAFLFTGRLSFHAKANPYPMYLALEEAARRTGKRIALIQCGWFANEGIELAFREGAERHAPNVRHLWLDGRKAPQRDRAWAAGDVFITLSDNIQETFGLTPLEAMAAGMPVIATDWDGYRQTVRHGECGLLVPTFAPAPGAGERYGAAHGAEVINYDHYLAQTAQHVSIDLRALYDATELLVADADKRRAMGEAGRAIARSEFDWSLIIRRYIEFWNELGAIRKAVAPDDPRRQPRTSSDRLDPFRLFANYPTRAIDAATVLRQREGAGDPVALLSDRLFGTPRGSLPADEAFVRLVRAIGRGAVLGVAARQAKIDETTAILMATVLLKTGQLETG